jgi:hypothetical protein
MSYVSASGGGFADVLKKGRYVVPLWGYAAGQLDDGNKIAAGLLVAAGAIIVMLFVVGLPTAIGVAAYRASGFQDGGMAWRGMGAAGTDTVKRSDGYSWSRSADKKDTFLNHGVGPEFVEQPNYLLGQEDMQRHALSKWNHLKASGSPVSDWPTFWAAYKAENSDDLSASMYDFGSDGFKGSAKELQGAGLGR